MTRLPRTKDAILDEAGLSPFVATNQLEYFLPLLLEVLVDIRDGLEVPHLLEEDITE